jgi:hypothetical protein
MKRQIVAISLAFLFGTGLAMADEQTYWAKIAQNPFADTIKLPIENRLDGNLGYNDVLNNRFAFQPSMISEMSAKWILVNRMDIPFIYQPGRKAGERDSFGIGDITYESLYGPSKKQMFFWGIGPTLQIPSATDNQLGTKKWSTGIACAITLVKGPLVAGVRANQLWSIAGKSDRDDVNQTAIEYFIYANVGHGWWIGTSPVNHANWEATADEAWTIPLGGGIGKVVGHKHPINVKIEAYSYTKAPNDYADWSIMLGLEFLIPENSLFSRPASQHRNQ